MPVLLFVSLFITLLSFNTNSASAQIALVSGCTSNSGYSTTTGQSCAGPIVPGCTGTSGFSSTTGQLCSGVSSGGGGGGGGGSGSGGGGGGGSSPSQFLTIGSKGDDVRSVQRILKNEGYFLGTIDGKYGKKTVRAVKSFQDDNDLPVTGNVDAATWAVLSTFGVIATTPTPTTPPIIVDSKCALYGTDCAPVISGVKGPQSLNVNEQGTWTVVASSASGGKLGYTVDWGDQSYLLSNGIRTGLPVQQSATFTYSYSQAGAYTPTFTVCLGESGVCTKTSLSVNVGNLTTPSVTVISPNGGGYWYLGQKAVIEWKTVNIPKDNRMDIRLRSEDSGTEYYLTNASNDGNEPIIVPSSTPYGAYRLEVKTSVSGVSYIDASDSYFKIVSDSSISNTPPKIVGFPAILKSIQPGQTVNFSWTANDADNDDLSWSINWGDGIAIASSCSINRLKTGMGKTYSTSHAWTQAGVYKVGVTVSDCVLGTGYVSNSDSNSFMVTVGSATTSSDTLSASLLSQTDDRAGKWYTFTRGSGSSGNSADWVWQANLTLGSAKKVKSVVMKHNTWGEFWSSSSDQSTIGKLAYPLVLVTDSGVQLNTAYDQNFSYNTSMPAYGDFTFPAGSYTYKLYAQTESTKFTGGTLTFTFTDGTSVSASVPASDYSPISTPVITPVTPATPSITVLSPNGGETYKIGDTINFTWRSQGFERVIINIDNLDNGHRYSTFDANNGLDANTGSASWIVRNSNLPAGRYKVFVTGYNVSNNLSNTDFSDNSFTITAPVLVPVPTITLSPAANNGGNYVVGSSNIIIGWTANNFPTNTGDRVDVYLVPTDGSAKLKMASNYWVFDGKDQVNFPVNAGSRLQGGWDDYMGKSFKVRVECQASNLTPNGGNTCFAESTGVINITAPSPATISASLNTASSTASQFVPAGNGGVANATKASYRFSSSGGTSTINEFKFTVAGTNTATSVSVSGVSAPVVSGVAYITGLNLPVPNGGGGLSVDAYVSYPPVGVIGIQSGTISSITLTSIKYSSNGVTATSSPNVSAPDMVLVGSKPTLTLNSSGAALANGLVDVGHVTISADAKGDITINQLPIVVALASGVTASGSVVVKDQNSTPVATTDGGFTTMPEGVKTNINFTGGYLISAGTSKTFSIYITVAGVSGPVGTLYASLGLNSSSLFNWTDKAGNASSPISSDNSTYFYNYPTNKVTILSAASSIFGLTASAASALSSIPPGCTSTSGFSITTGKSCSSR